MIEREALPNLAFQSDFVKAAYNCGTVPTIGSQAFRALMNHAVLLGNETRRQTLNPSLRIGGISMIKCYMPGELDILDPALDVDSLLPGLRDNTLERIPRLGSKMVVLIHAVYDDVTRRE